MTDKQQPRTKPWKQHIDERMNSANDVLGFLLAADEDDEEDMSDKGTRASVTLLLEIAKDRKETGALYARVHPVDEARVEEIRERQKQRKRFKQPRPNPRWPDPEPDIDYLLSLLPKLSSSERRCDVCRREAFEEAAIIAENCTQDDAARDEPFRIAATIREHARRESTTEGVTKRNV